jgi:hypothetical protein
MRHPFVHSRGPILHNQDYGHLPILGLNEYLSAAILPLVFGGAVGFFALFYLRAARLRWTWGLFGAPLACLVWPIDWHIGLGFACATFAAAGGGAYWHFEDVGRGGDDAREARETVGVFHVLRSHRARRRASEGRVRPAKARTAGRRVSEDRLAIGINRRGGVRQVPFGSERGVHALVLGATGSGKTVTKSAITESYVLSGIPAIAIDPKGDRYLYETMRDAAEQAGMPFREWSPTARTIYNPFERGEPTEIADKALQGHEWSEPHYEMATQRLLGQVLPTMQAAGIWPPTLSQIVRYMDPERLDGLGSQVGGEVGARVAEYVDGLSAKARADLGGGRDRLAILAEGKFGPRIDPGLGKGPVLSLKRALSQGEVIYMNLDADRYPAASKLLAAALVMDLVTLVAEMQGNEARGLLVIDEFAALAAGQVSRLFGRARSAGLSVLLGTQSLADLRGARSDDPSDTLTEQVLTNIEFAVVHREADPDSAERLARMAGTQPSWTTTERVGGKRDSWFQPREGTRTKDREFVVPPDEFKRLGTGEAVVIDPMSKPPAEIVRVFAPRDRGPSA